MDNGNRISFTIPGAPRRPVRPAAAAAADGEFSASAPPPVPQFIKEFGPSQTLTTTAGPAVIAPLPNSGHFLTHRPRNPSSLPTPEEEASLAASAAGAPTFELDNSTAPDNPSSHIPYGLSFRNAAATEPEKKPPSPAADAPSGDLTLRRYKEDMAILPDHRGIDEFDEVPVEGFGAALLAGYGWSEGTGIGRNNNKGDTKIVEYGRRAGTQGLGYHVSST